MKSPFTGLEMSIHREWRIIKFRKEEFEVLSHFYVCNETGEKFEDEIFSQLNYNQCINQYRAKYSIPFPEQIIAIREKYGIPAIKMAEILGFGANSYRQYEAGEVPNQSNARLIQLADDPHEFKKLVDLCNTLEKKSKDKLYQKIRIVLENQNRNEFHTQLESYFFETSMPDKYTGYKKPSLSKFTEMVLFFAEQLKPWKTKLNKLLFYSDFSSYRQTCFSISGVQYKAIPMGPVPNNFNSIFDYMTKNGDIDIIYTDFPDGGTGEQFISNRKRIFDPALFSENELHILEAISERFKDTSTGEIIEMSHKEKAWLDNVAERKTIDYNYSFDMN